MEEAQMLATAIQKRETLQIKKRELLDLLEQTPGRIEMLNEQDRAFVNLMLTSQKFRTIANAAGVHEATIARRLKKIAARLTSDNFVNALSEKNLTPKRMQILRDYFVDGFSMLQIARKNNANYYEVRKLIKENLVTVHDYQNSASS
jgi:hypothetical protein